MPVARVHRISASAPDDVRGIEDAIASGSIDPRGIVAIFGKTEGNGCVNDFTRGYATQSLGLMLQRALPHQRAAEVCLVMSGGTEGAMAPHWVVFERTEGGWKMRVNYEVRRPLVGNLDVVGRFDSTQDLTRHGGGD